MGPEKRSQEVAGERARVGRPTQHGNGLEPFRDEAEEEQYLLALIEEGAHPQRVFARLALGTILERRNLLEDAAELYERNLWVGAHDVETFRRLIGVYRRLRRDDLVEVTSEQMARQWPVARAPSRPQARRTASFEWREIPRAAGEWLDRLGGGSGAARTPGLGAALGWLALAVLFAAGAAFVFTLVSPALGSPGQRPASSDAQRGVAAVADPPPPPVAALSSTTPPQQIDRGAPKPPAPAGPPPFASAGLGAGREDWERAHGGPERGDLFVEYEAGRYTVGFLDGTVWYIERVWGNRDAVSLEAARGASRELMPVDARLSRTINPTADQVVDLHTSDGLSGRFKPTAWNGGQQGNFTVRYRLRANDGQVVGMQFRLGDGQ